MTQTRHEPTTGVLPAAASQTYTTFRLQDGLFGAATEVVKEVTALPPLTPIPHAPAAIRGYVNLRGHIVLVVDLNCLWNRAPTAVGPDCRLIVFKPELGDAFGVLAERSGDIVNLPAGRIETLSGAGVDAAVLPDEELIRGVGKLDGDLLLILDVRRLLPRLERAVANRGQTPAGPADPRTASAPGADPSLPSDLKESLL